MKLKNTQQFPALGCPSSTPCGLDVSPVGTVILCPLGTDLSPLSLCLITFPVPGCLVTLQSCYSQSFSQSKHFPPLAPNFRFLLDFCHYLLKPNPVFLSWERLRYILLTYKRIRYMATPSAVCPRLTGELEFLTGQREESCL